MGELQLHDYQELGRDFLRTNARSALFLDMGLGKTATALSALTDDHLPALVIAPKRVAREVWPAEARLWRPDLKVVVAQGSPTKRESAHRVAGLEADVLVISRENLGDIPRFYGRKLLPWRTIILDELSGFKNYRTARWKHARRMVRKVPHVWGLTGTPSPNGYMDLWSQIYLLDQGQRLGSRITQYRSRYFVEGRRTPTGVVTEWIARPETPTRVNRLIEDICLSMQTDGRIQLPPVTFNDVAVPLDSPHRAMYRRLRRDSILDLRTLGGTKHVADTAAALSNRLQQLTAGFQYNDDKTYDLIHTNKAEAVAEIVEGTGSPVLVLYKYRAELAVLQKLLPQAKTLWDKDIIDRWNRGEVPVLIGHPASLGHGLNLQHGGHTAVWTTLPWSLEEWEQTNKRLNRQGQKHPVVIHTLSTPGTIDTAVAKALREKSSVQQALLDHLESPL